ncbi:lipid asymmetry maintenance protein MlaB [Massilia sp. NR 4-1]|uniref:STAS domain-containing protein n=1 Tax=Massilia sp. NR 4-1 TaxID=1678028 RepID=UPI00067C7CFE|nr:STAS domain-containing protein [Massilia sp. NR 4-1]AKU23371.1 hypothetical protein ACZ75_19815 [Massilia sp. NR 4-1]
MSAANNNSLSLTSLTVANATVALEQGLAAIRAGQTTFDLSQVTAVDSAAVSVMLAWQRAAAQAGVRLDLQSLPDSLKSLTKLYGVCPLIASAPAPVAEEPALSPANLHHH